jgi:hypothetical protein
MVWSATQIHPVWLVRPLLVVTAVVVAVTVVASLLLGDRDRGGVVAFAVSVAIVVVDLRLAAALVALATIVVADAVLSRGRPWRHGTAIRRGLSVVGAALVGVTLATAVADGALDRAIADVAGDVARPAPAATFDPAAPDILVVLLDGYPGDDAAAALDPSFDANAFPSALEQRGFEVQRHSHSNYLATHLAIPALFTGRYAADLPSMGPPYRSTADDERRLRLATDDSELLRTLGRAGYETITVGSGWSQLGGRRVDRIISSSALNEFELLLAGNSAVGVALDAINPSFAGDEARARIEAAFSASEQLAAEQHQRPRFIFVHVPAPHLPYVYGRRGEAVTGGPRSLVARRDGLELERSDRIGRTFAQVAYIGDRTVVMLDRVLAFASRPSVVVVWSDHGTDVDWILGDPLAAGLTERTSNFLAVLSPGHSGLFRAGTTPVNVLPQVFNAYLGTDLPLQEDRTFGWRGGTPSLIAVPLEIP